MCGIINLGIIGDNMNEQFSRTELMFGSDALEKLNKSTVCVFGLGGVGGHLAEALARAGVGSLYLVDNDIVSPSDLNRQIIATLSTLGMAKTQAAKERILSIAPDCKVITADTFFLPDTDFYDFSIFSYVADAIDTVSGKIEICKRAKQAGVRVISAMGAGNKIDPTAFRVADISKTKVCPLARVMRQELKKRNINNVKCVYSEEPPFELKEKLEKGESGKITPGSNSFVPSVMGLIMAGEIIKDIINSEV